MTLLTVDKMYPEVSKYMDLLNKIPGMSATIERSTPFSSEMRMVVVSYICDDGTGATCLIVFWYDEDPTQTVIRRLSGHRFIDWSTPPGVLKFTLPTFGNLNELRMKLQLMGVGV